MEIGSVGLFHRGIVSQHDNKNLFGKHFWIDANVAVFDNSWLFIVYKWENVGHFHHVGNI
jgi:hypothetical protein